MMNFRSYQEKVFVVESSRAIIRNDQLKELKYVAGEDIPAKVSATLRRFRNGLKSK